MGHFFFGSPSSSSSCKTGKQGSGTVRNNDQGWKGINSPRLHCPLGLQDRQGSGLCLVIFQRMYTHERTMFHDINTTTLKVQSSSSNNEILGFFTSATPSLHLGLGRGSLVLMVPCAAGTLQSPGEFPYWSSGLTGCRERARK